MNPSLYAFLTLFLLLTASMGAIIGSIPLTSGISIPAVEDLNCKTKGKQRCDKCYPSFYYNLVSKHCVPVSPLCQTWNDEGECKSCFDGYKLVIGICAIETKEDAIANDLKDPNCFAYVNGTCEECAHRFYFNKERICTTVHPDCRSWDKLTGACTSCFDGFYLSGRNCLSSTGSKISLTAVIPTSLNNSTFVEIENCAEYNGSQCSVCAFRYYQMNGSCYQVSDLCKSWNNDDGSCTRCYSGYDIWEGKCTLRDPFCTIKTAGMCVQCMNRYYLDIHLKCQGVSPLCKAYDPLAGICTECYEGYGLQINGECGIN